MHIGQPYAEPLEINYFVLEHSKFATKLDMCSIVLVLIVLHRWFYYVAIYGKLLTLTAWFHFVAIYGELMIIVCRGSAC
jgi:hypothetical protein